MAIKNFESAGAVISKQMTGQGEMWNLDFSRYPGFSDSEIASLRLFMGIRSLNLQGASISVNGIRSLAKESPGIQEIDISGIDLDAEGVRELSKFSKLRSLTAWYVIKRDGDFPDFSESLAYERLDLSECVVLERNMKAISKMDSLVELKLRHARLREPTLTLLNRLPNLKSLDLSWTDIGNEGIAVVGAMRGLSSLRLDDISMASNFTEISKMKGLLSLSVSRTAFDDRSLSGLLSLPDIKCLHLSGTRCTSKGIAHLKYAACLEDVGLSSLGLNDSDAEIVSAIGGKVKNLQIAGNNLTKAGIAHLAKIKTLRTLSIDANPVGDDAVKCLKLLPDLEAIGLRKTNITDACLAELLAFPKMRFLDVQDTRVSETAVNTFREKRPSVRILWGRDSKTR